MKTKVKLIKRGYTHWLPLKNDYVKKIGYKAGDEVEINIRCKLVPVKQGEEPITTRRSLRDTKPNE